MRTATMVERNVVETSRKFVSVTRKDEHAGRHRLHLGN